jgi:hypothetical protein
MVTGKDWFREETNQTSNVGVGHVDNVRRLVPKTISIAHNQHTLPENANDNPSSTMMTYDVEIP